MTNVENLVRQISIVNAALGRTFSTDPAKNVSYVLTLANYLDSKGTTDIRNLQQYVNEAANLRFFFDGKTGWVYSDTTFGQVDPTFTGTGDGKEFLFYAFPGDDENVILYLNFTSDGYPVFWSRTQYTGNTWHDFAQGVLFVASIVVAYAYPALAAQIGTAVCGATIAAQYPALASAIGNAVVGSALNGGDVQAAVVASIGGAAGSAVGGAAFSVTDSAIIGRAASAATSALVTGGDLKTAVATSLIKSGVSDMAQLVRPAQTLGDYDFNGPDTGTIYAPTTEIDPFTGQITGSYPADFNGDGTISFSDLPATYDFTQPVSTPGSNAVPSGPSGSVLNVGGADLTQLALTGLKLVAAWNQAGQPAVRAGTSSSTVNKNGTLTQMTSSGAVVNQRMPVGTPYMAADGSLVTNNGNGTYTTVAPSGNIQTSRYTATGLLGGLSLDGNTMLYAGIGIVALLLLTRRGGQ